MSEVKKKFEKYSTEYDPIKNSSIDGTDTIPHDRAATRAERSHYLAPRLARSDPQCTIFIGRLNPRTTQDTIKSEFSKFGKVVSCRLVKDIVTGKSKQYAFVEYADVDSLERALQETWQYCVDGATVVAEREAARRLPGWRPRRLGGGFGGRKEAGQLRFGGRARPFWEPIPVKNNPRHDHDTSHNRS